LVARGALSFTKRLKTKTARFFAKRTSRRRFNEMDVIGRSLTRDRRRKAKGKVTSGYGDRGDRGA
jgi:hypothetical protein